MKNGVKQRNGEIQLEESELIYLNEGIGLLISIYQEKRYCDMLSVWYN
jgi:hypothetical protein